MSKITSSQVKNDFEEIIGWTYVSPGTNDINGIDCSGAWVRCYKKYGFTILHGSNSIYRKECSSTGQISSDDDLKVGMMVFKNRFDGKEPEKFQSDGLGNFYHIGAVTGVNPLVITHATSPNAKQDTKFNSNRNGWTHWGIGNKVEISDIVIDDDTNESNEAVATSGELQGKNCKVVTDDKTSVNMRKDDNKKGALIVRVPDGEIVLVTSDIGESYVGTRWENNNNIYNGFMCRDFLEIYDEDSETIETDEDPETIEVDEDPETIEVDEDSEVESSIKSEDVSEFYAIKKGSKGGAVRRLQKWLVSLDFDLNCDGDFGEKTENAVKYFQKTHGLTDDGYVGQKTWEALSNARIAT